METLVSNPVPGFVQTHHGHNDHGGHSSPVVVVGQGNQGLEGKDAAFISGLDITRQIGGTESNLMGTLLRGLQEISVNVERTSGFNALNAEKAKNDLDQRLSDKAEHTLRQLVALEKDNEKRHAELKDLIQKLDADRVKSELADVKLKYELDQRFAALIPKVVK